MKTATAYPRYYRPRQVRSFPNAATPRQVFGRIVDILLVAASGAGLGAILLLSLVLA